MATTASAVINTTDTAAGTPTVPDATITTKWQEYLWIRHVFYNGTPPAPEAKVYAWNTNATSDATYFKWQEVGEAANFSDLSGSATIAQLPTGITVSNLSIDGAITNTHLAGGITNANLAGSIVYSKITSVDAASVTSVNNSKIPVNTIPTLTNTNVDTILGSGSVDYDKLSIDDDTIPAAKLKNEITSAQITSLDAAKVTSGTMSQARLDYMFERNLPIDSVNNAAGTYNLHTELGTASAVFEGIIRVVATAGSDEVIIVLPHPSVSAYLQKAAKLSVYRGTSRTPGKVTIKVCASGTDSSSFATDKIVDNNNGEITDQVVIMPQLGPNSPGSRTVTIDSEVGYGTGAHTSSPGIEVDPLPIALISGQTLFFSEGGRLILSALASLGATTIYGTLYDNALVNDEGAVVGKRKVVIDLLNDSISTDDTGGQWIVSGGASMSGKGILSVSGFRTGGGTGAAPGEGAQIDGGIGINKQPSPGSGQTTEIGTDDGDVPPATEATMFAREIGSGDPGQQYTVGQIVTIDDDDWDVEPEWEITKVATEGWKGQLRTLGRKSMQFVDGGATGFKQGVYSGSGHKWIKPNTDNALPRGGVKPVLKTLKFAASNTVTTTTPTFGTVLILALQGMQPLGTDGQPLEEGDSWYDPWTGITHEVGP